MMILIEAAVAEFNRMFAAREIGQAQTVVCGYEYDCTENPEEESR